MPRRPPRPRRVVAAVGLLVAAVAVAVAATVSTSTARQADDAGGPTSTSTSTPGRHPDVTDRPSSTPSPEPTSSAAAEPAPSTGADGTGADGTGAGAGVAPNGSGQAMPTSSGPGWTRTFSDDFAHPVAAGRFPGRYDDSWVAYDGFTDTSGIGDYRADAVSVRDGVLDLAVSAGDGAVTSAAVVPLVGGEWGGQVHGRFSVRMRADAVPGFYAAFLLWSDDNDWDDGEVDFPEGRLDGTVNGYNHTPGDPSVNSFVGDTGISFDGWHTYTIEWRPDRIDYLVDDRVWATTSEALPTASMHWVMQVEAAGETPPDGAGHVEIDWATIDRYDG